MAVEDYGDAHHVYIRSLTIHDVNGSDAVKHNGDITYTCVGATKPSRFIDLRIENNQIYHVDRSGIMGMSDRWERSKWYPSLDVAVRGNVLSDIGGDGIVVVATDGAVVEHNILGHANQRSEGYNGGIWPWSADNTLIQYNEAYGTKSQRDGEGFDSDWNTRNTVIQYNYSHDNDGGFLLICNDGGQKARDQRRECRHHRSLQHQRQRPHARDQYWRPGEEQPDLQQHVPGGTGTPCGFVGPIRLERVG